MDRRMRRVLGRVGKVTLGVDTTGWEYVGHATRKIPWGAVLGFMRKPEIIVIVLKDEVIVIRMGRILGFRRKRLWTGPKSAVKVGPQRRYTGTFTFGELTLHLPHPQMLRRAIGQDPLAGDGTGG